MWSFTQTVYKFSSHLTVNKLPLQLKSQSVEVYEYNHCTVHAAAVTSVMAADETHAQARVRQCLHIQTPI
jgi:hypothetical protein